MAIWRRVLVVNSSFSLLLAAASLASALLPAAAQTTRGSREVNAEGVVVAVQLEPDTVRSSMALNSESLGDFAEVWMVRVRHKLSVKSGKYILVEYTHVNRHEPFVKDRELDTTVWKFRLSPPSKNETGTCGSWSDRFVPTAFGKERKLPTPGTLACFQMQKRPVSAQ